MPKMITNNEIDIENGRLKFKDKSSNEWLDANSKPGENASNPIKFLTEAAPYYVGNKIIWTTLGDKVPAFQIGVDFDTPGGPWYRIRWIVGGGFDLASSQGSVIAQGYDGSDKEGTFKDFDSGTYNIQLGEDKTSGDKRLYELVGSDVMYDAGGKYTNGDYYNLDYGKQSISYYNVDMGVEFSSEQIQALRETICHLSPDTPYIGWNCDSDANDDRASIAGVNWLSFSDQDEHKYIHGIVFDDGNGDWQHANTRASGEQTSTVDVWTEKTWKNYNSGGGTSAVYAGGTPKGMQYGKYAQDGLRNSWNLAGMIMPSQFELITNSGGGCGFGVYDNPNVQGKNVCLMKDDS